MKAPGRRFLLVLGDSLARGTGDETGKGYAADVLDSLKKSGAADMANLAVNGAESGDVERVLESENVGRLAASADWILLSAGGNDLSHSVPRETADGDLRPWTRSPGRAPAMRPISGTSSRGCGK